ncbi:rod shape-determining protein MreD [Streptomyces sp. WMMB 714]|jgi:rod shape-determining protein MreD|uniref:rod shape-determining protein MreD n=1 Tax=Streptomyces sp. WMMB 714 TaxID=1286822 RepID=UPI0005F849A8|nr:rod shape-determining protein MreD [Streptomyces sp. WMMB 714]SCK20118.1 rod shape-determining protein MreD [Streptomyces sp. WMMB 714]
MHLNRILLSAVLVVGALIVQVSVLARLQLPGAVPDLLLLVVLGLAMVYGHTAGALTGFAGGLLADLAPPAEHAVGRYALVLCVIGYAAGLTKPDNGQHRSATVPMLVVASAAVSSTLLYAGVGTLVGDTAAGRVGLLPLLLTATLYDLLLAPFVVPALMWLARRTERAPITSDASGVGSMGRGDKAAYGWLSSGTGLQIGGSSSLFGKGRNGGTVRNARNGKAVRMGIQRGSLLDRPGRKGKGGKIKGVKRL